jgi:hypothetical protein
MNNTTENILNDTSEKAKQKSSQNKANPSPRNLVKPLPFGYQECRIVSNIGQDFHKEMTYATASTLTSNKSLKLQIVD